MPEFIIDTGGCEQFAKLDDFTQGYIEAMFFTDTGTGDDEEGGLEHANVAEFAPGEIDAIWDDCQRWQFANQDKLTAAYETGRYDARRAGNDYWYTRNGHGVGFWDRELGDIGDELSNACRYSERNLYRDDDGLLYCS